LKSGKLQSSAVDAAIVPGSPGKKGAKPAHILLYSIYGRAHNSRISTPRSTAPFGPVDRTQFSVEPADSDNPLGGLSSCIGVTNKPNRKDRPDRFRLFFSDRHKPGWQRYLYNQHLAREQ
jgi:hypothetical protein